MLITESFATQLDDLLHRVCIKLQLSETQYKRAEESYYAIARWLEADGSPVAEFDPIIYPQGSLRIQTTVRPLQREEYDLDLVCEINVDWRSIPNPVFLLDAMEGRLKQHERYARMVERKNRCVRVNYANDFHLDIVPACPDATGGYGCVVVPDCEAKSWKPSNPKGYATWFESQTERLTESFKAQIEPLPDHEPVDYKLPLKRVVQLMKRWRDIAYAGNREQEPSSIMLTTLAGELYGGHGNVAEGLGAILDQLASILKANDEPLQIWNPANPQELLSERWEEDTRTYESFRVGIANFKQKWDELSRRRGHEDLTTGLEQLFGEGVRSALREQAEFVEKARTARELGVARGTGMLSAMAGSHVIPVRSNTFFGA